MKKVISLINEINFLCDSLNKEIIKCEVKCLLEGVKRAPDQDKLNWVQELKIKSREPEYLNELLSLYSFEVLLELMKHKDVVIVAFSTHILKKMILASTELDLDAVVSFALEMANQENLFCQASAVELLKLLSKKPKYTKSIEDFLLLRNINVCCQAIL